MGFNTTLPGAAQRTRGTRVYDRERKGDFRQKELRSTSENTDHTGPEWEGGWGGGAGQYQRVMVSAAAGGLWTWFLTKIRMVGSG